MKKILQLFVLLLIPFLGFSQVKGVDFSIDNAMRTIRSSYGDRVVVDSKILRKFGENPDINTSVETIWQVGGNENYPSISEGNVIHYVSSSNAGDTQSMLISGITIDPSDSSLSNVVQSVTLTGQTSAALSTPLYRINRVINDSNTDLSGDVYAYRQGTTVTAGVPQEADSIHVQVEAAYNQTHKAAVTLPSGEYWVITELIISVESSSNQIRRADAYLEVRNFNKVFRRIVEISASNEGGAVEMSFYPALIIPPRSDVRMTAVASGTGTEVAVDINGYIVSVQ